MPKRMVDAYDANGMLVASIPIIINILNAATEHEDFLEEARRSLREDGVDLSRVKKWVVRDPP